MSEELNTKCIFYSFPGTVCNLDQGEYTVPRDQSSAGHNCGPLRHSDGYRIDPWSEEHGAHHVFPKDCDSVWLEFFPPSVAKKKNKLKMLKIFPQWIFKQS